MLSTINSRIPKAKVGCCQLSVDKKALTADNLDFSGKRDFGRFLLKKVEVGNRAKNGGGQKWVMGSVAVPRAVGASTLLFDKPPPRLSAPLGASLRALRLKAMPLGRRKETAP